MKRGDDEPGVVMGVLNVTQDSFSDGGQYLAFETALAHARQMTVDGADIIDVGGESTRPGAHRVSQETEADRVLPIIRELRQESIVVSVDTLNAETARQALEAGAHYVNDVSGGLADADMASVVAAHGAKFIVGHRRGTSATMNELATYDDVVGEVVSELTERIEEAVTAGVDAKNIVVDPGLGFAKTPEHNWTLLSNLTRIVALGYPVLVGASRKRFIGELLPSDAPMVDRDAPSAVVAALAVDDGAWGVRVHDVRATRAALLARQRWRAVT